MPDPTKTPCRGQITDFDGESGTIATETGAKVRFGHSGCSGFDPRVGLDVWLMALRTLPVIGERATLVNLTGQTESADPEQRARERNEAKERALREMHAGHKTRKGNLRDRAHQASLPDGWHPGLAGLADVLKLPPALASLNTRPIHVKSDDPSAEFDGSVDLATAERIAPGLQESEGEDPVIRFGGCSPWPMYDPCLVPFAQVEGEEPDLFALFFHPELYGKSEMLPVVYWRHDDERKFVAPDAATFLRAVAHGQYFHDGQRVGARSDLTTSLALEVPEGGLEITEAPDTYLRYFFGETGERGAVANLSKASLGDEYEDIIQQSELLEALYSERRWEYHVRAVRHQRREFFGE